MAAGIWREQWWQIGIAIAVTSGALFSGNSTVAQIAPDNTLGAESSVVTPNVDIKGVPSDRIDGGAVRGANLFHSLQEFNVREGRGAYFSNPAGIENILSRVTGSNPSNILGTLGVLGNANLFFLNPNGIIFGPNAKLDMGGSFFGSTANSLNFEDGKLFSATSPNAPPLLTMKVPLGVQFGTGQPSAIVNSGNLSVGKGQNLTLTGGTVVSTGQLSAPEGQVAVAAVPSESLVKINPSAQLLNIDTPSLGSGKSSLSVSLAELLASVDEKARPGLTVNSNGQVELAGSGLPVEDGDVVAKNVTAQTATLTAIHNLTLVESLLATTGDMNLLAGDTVRVRDSAANPFVAQAGGNLLVQGRQGVDIFALNHPSSGLFSGGDMVLRSANTVGGDAHYWAGGNFRIEQMDGSLGGLFSPYDPIIRARGDVSFDSYTGGSLHIFAGGSVTVPGTVTITGADGTNGLVQRVFLSDDDPNGDRSFVDIDGINYPTLDIRAGTTAFNPVGNIPEIVNLRVSSEPTSANIQIGSIVNNQPDGQIFLTNQYQRNDLVEGSIEIQDGIRRNQDIFSIITLGNPVTIDARGNVQIAQGITTGVAEGTGGDIKILSVENIEIFKGDNGFDAGLTSVVNAVRGAINPNNKSGNITLISTDGEINTQGKITTFSSSGEAGDIILKAKNDITIGNEIASRILEESPETQGNAGDITITSDTGNIIGQITSYTLNQIISSTLNGTGGKIELNAPQGSITTTGWTINARSKNGVAGDVTLQARGDIRSGNIEASSNSNDRYSKIELESLQGSVILNEVKFTTTNTGSDYAGDIFISAGNDANNNVEITSSNIETDGYFGKIFIDVGDNVSIKNSVLSAQAGADLPNPNPDLATDDGQYQAGNIEVISETGKIEISKSFLFTSTGSPFASAGDITLAALDAILINESDIRSRLLQNTTSNNLNVGSINVSTDKLTVENDSEITVGSPEGKAGDLNFFANRIFLDGGKLIATAGSEGDGANINLKGLGGYSPLDLLSLEEEALPDSPLRFLLMENESKIEANATKSASGGNININTELLIALPPTELSGSDITANALEIGDGGRVNIGSSDRLGVYGIQRREEQTRFNDITASSQQGQQGSVSISQPDVDPERGLIQLPENLGDSSRLISQSCPVGGTRAASRFVVTGRGGLPPSPSSALSSDALMGNTTTNISSGESRPMQSSSPSTTLVEAQGINIGSKGEIIFTAKPSKLTSYSSWQKNTGCNAQ